MGHGSKTARVTAYVRRPKSIAAQVHDIDWASQTPGGEEERIGDWGAAAPGALDALVEIPPLPNRGFPRRHPQLLTPYTG